MTAAQKFFFWLMIVLYVAAGINHFVNKRIYMSIMPLYIPYHTAMVYISGVCEIAFALLLIPQSTRPIGAWLIILLLIAVFPANIQTAVIYYNKHSPRLWLSIARLPLQLVLIWWAWLYTKLK